MKTPYRWNIKTAIMAVAIALILAGCMDNYGRLKTNPDLTNTFKKQLELPDYNYYYCGRENLPYAVVGIDRGYEFQMGTWHKIETREDVYEKAAGVLTWNPNWSQGADVLDPSGKKIGIWFSYYLQTAVKVGPENKVAVYNPYNPNDDSRGVDTQHNPVL